MQGDEEGATGPCESPPASLVAIPGAIVELEEMVSKYAQDNIELETAVAEMKRIERSHLSEIAGLQQTVAAQNRVFRDRVAELQHEAAMYASPRRESKEAQWVGEPEAVASDLRQLDWDHVPRIAPRNAELERKLQAHSQRSVKLEGKIADMEQELKESAAQNRHLHELAANAQRQEMTICELRLVEDNLTSQVADLQNALDESSSKVADLQTALAASADEASARRRELEEVTAAHAKCSSRLEAVLDAMQRTKQDHEARVAELQDALHRTEDNAALCQKQNIDLEDQLVSLRLKQREHEKQLVERDALIVQFRLSALGGDPTGGIDGTISTMAARIATLEASRTELQGAVQSTEDRGEHFGPLKAAATPAPPAREDVCVTPRMSLRDRPASRLRIPEGKDKDEQLVWRQASHRCPPSDDKDEQRACRQAVQILAHPAEGPTEPPPVQSPVQSPVRSPPPPPACRQETARLAQARAVRGSVGSMQVPVGAAPLHASATRHHGAPASSPHPSFCAAAPAGPAPQPWFSLGGSMGALPLCSIPVEAMQCGVPMDVTYMGCASPVRVASPCQRLHSQLSPPIQQPVISTARAGATPTTFRDSSGRTVTPMRGQYFYQFRNHWSAEGAKDSTLR